MKNFLMDSRIVGREALQGYIDHIKATDPHLRQDLPSLVHESDRLIHTIESEIVERHRPDFAAYISTILPGLWRDKTVLQRQVELGGRWSRSGDPVLMSLTPDPDAPQPRLVRTSSGKVLMIDGHLLRHVGSRVLAYALEESWGEIENLDSDKEPAGYQQGPPVVVLRDQDGELYCVAGGKRHRLKGLPVPRDASPAELERYPLSSDLINVDRSNVGRSEARRRLRRVEVERDSLLAERDRLRRMVNRRIVRIALTVAKPLRPLFGLRHTAPNDRT